MCIAISRTRMTHLVKAFAGTSVRDAASIWQQIEHGVREACMMRGEGRTAEATALLQTALPPLIRDWSENSGLPGETCRAELRALFAKVQDRVAKAMMSRRSVLASIRADNVRAGASVSSALHVNRRIPLDDVPDMLDALQDSERAAVAARGDYFSTPSSRSLAIAAAG